MALGLGGGGGSHRRRDARKRTAAGSRAGTVHPERGNQDACLSHECPDFAVAGVLDGHGVQGAECAQAAAEALRDALLASLSTAHGAKKRAPALDLETVVRDAFRVASETVDGVEGSVGSGCVVSVVVVRGNECVVATIGDATVLVMGLQSGYSSRLVPRFKTRNHRVDVASERERVEASGARIVKDRYVVDKKDQTKGIMVTRTLGDSDMRRLGVIPEPEIHKLTLTRLDRFVVLATDGLWESDVLLTSQVTCDIVARVSRTGNQQDIVDELFRRTEELGMLDDCTIACIKLH